LAAGLHVDKVATIGSAVAGTSCSPPKSPNTAVSAGRPAPGADTVDEPSNGAEAVAVPGTMPDTGDGRLAKTASITGEANGD
jgi:hypothetical protein